MDYYLEIFDKDECSYFILRNLICVFKILLITMSLFSAKQDAPPMMKVPVYAQKQHLFHQEIRRRQNNKKFQAIREELAQSLKSLSFLEDLKSERDNYTPKRIQQLVKGLEMGRNQVFFYQKILDMSLDHYLCDILRNPELNLHQQCKILHTLVQLTYFCSDCSDSIIENHTIDTLMDRMKLLQMEDQTEQNFTYFAATLTLNLTSFPNIDLVNYIMESDFMSILQDLVEISSRKEDNMMYYRSDIREVMLKIFNNLFFCKESSNDFISLSLLRLFNDHRNSENEHLIENLFACLASAAQHEGLWEKMAEKDFLGQVEETYLTLKIYLKQGKDVLKSIDNLVRFVETLAISDQSLLNEDAENIIQFFQPGDFMLFVEFLHQLETGQSKKVLCRVFKILSLIFQSPQYVSFSSLFFNKQELHRFIQILLVRHFITHRFSGKYAMKVLWELLKENKTLTHILVENGVYDAIMDILELDYLDESKIEMITLVEEMIRIEESFRKDKQANELIDVLYNRGVIPKIEMLQDHDLQELYERADAFIKWVSQIRPDSDKQ